MARFERHRHLERAVAVEALAGFAGRAARDDRPTLRIPLPRLPWKTTPLGLTGKLSCATLWCVEIKPITVVEFDSFIRSAAMAGMSEAERGELVDFLARNPLAGDLVRGTGGLRKIRWARPGEGKRGGYRAIFYYYDEDVPIFAFLVYGKNQQADIPEDAKKAAAKKVEQIKAGLKAQRSARRAK